MRDDSALQVAAGCPPESDPPLASPPTLCRLENRITRQIIVDMHRVMVDQFLDSYKQPPEEITLYFDANDDPIHGEQEGRFFRKRPRLYRFAFSFSQFDLAAPRQIFLIPIDRQLNSLFQ